MAPQFQRVRPGDLIRSDLFNRMMDELESLEGRVKKLEGVSSGNTAKVIITEPNLSQTLHLGEPLKIVGKNFGLPSQNIVTLEDKIIDKFETGSGDDLLLIKTIPNLQDISEKGRKVTLFLTNAIGNATTEFMLAQPPITKPTGTLQTKLTTTPNEDIMPNKSFTFIYTISATTSMDDKYTIEPKVDLGWKAELVNEQNTPIKPPELLILKGPEPTVPTTIKARIRVTVPDVQGVEGKLTLTVKSKLNPDLKDTSDVAVLKVGGPPPEADQVGITLSSVVTPGKKSGNDIEVPLATAPGKNVNATFSVTVPKTGKYIIATPTFSPNPGNIWIAELVGASPTEMALEDQIRIRVKVPQTGAATTNMTLLVTKEGEPSIKGDRDIKILVT